MLQPLRFTLESTPCYHFAYNFDQYLYRPNTPSDEYVGVFGQFGISDGNPTRLYWSAHAGVSGQGLINPDRPNDTWGIGYYYSAFGDQLKNAIIAPLTLRDEQGVEIFYNFNIAPWLQIGADLQVIKPGASRERAAPFGIRTDVEF